MSDSEQREVPVLDALYELIDVSQPLGLHAPSVREREEIRTKAAKLRERVRARPQQPELAYVLEQVEHLESLLGRPHETGRWRTARAALVASYEDLTASLRERHGVALRGRYRVKPRNLTRSFFHVGSGVAWALAYEYFLDQRQMLFTLGAFLLLFLTDDAMRIWFPDRRGRIAQAIFRVLSRPSESSKISSSTWYTVGMIIGVIALPKFACLLGILVLAFADPAAALVGKRWGGRLLYRDKSVFGTTSFFVVALVISAAVIAVQFPGLGAGAWLGSAALIALAGTVAELLGDHVQDNISILLTTGFLASVLL